LDTVRTAPGTPLAQLTTAMSVTAALAEGATVVIDHLGELLAGGSAHAADQLSADLRSLAQDPGLPRQLLIGYAGAYLIQALGNEAHPLYGAGSTIEVERPSPSAFEAAMDGVPARRVSDAYRRARGAPVLIAEVLDGAESHGSVEAGWEILSRITRPAHQALWTALRRVHPQAQAVCACLANDLPPSRTRANPKSINDALGRLRGLGTAWQPAPGRWQLADMLFADHLRRNTPPSIAAERQPN
jgi:hypothetical protein